MSNEITGAALLEYLAQVVFQITPADFDKVAFAMYSACFDESGTMSKDRTLVVAGFSASVNQWVEFCHDWNAILQEFRVSFFHMTDFRGGHKEYAPWRNDKARRGEFLRRLVAIVKRRVDHAFGCAVLLDAYRKVDINYFLHEAVGHPYTFCGLHCALCVDAWAAQQAYDRPIKCIFEDGARYKGQLVDMMYGQGLPTPDFEAKRAVLGLQAADLLVWNLHRALTEVEDGVFKDFREDLQALADVPGMEGLGNVYAEAALLEQCKNMGIPERKPGLEARIRTRRGYVEVRVVRQIDRIAKR